MAYANVNMISRLNDVDWIPVKEVAGFLKKLDGANVDIQAERDQLLTSWRSKTFKVIFGPSMRFKNDQWYFCNSHPGFQSIFHSKILNYLENKNRAREVGVDGNSQNAASDNYRFKSSQDAKRAFQEAKKKLGEVLISREDSPKIFTDTLGVFDTFTFEEVYNVTWVGPAVVQSGSKPLINSVQRVNWRTELNGKKTEKKDKLAKLKTTTDATAKNNLVDEISALDARIDELNDLLQE